MTPDASTGAPGLEPNMPNNLSVTLDQSQSPCGFHVDQHGKGNEVGQSSTPQTISWHLNGNAAPGSFVAIDAPQPGFAWITPPPPGVFGAPTLSNNGNTLSITDNNPGQASAGTWTYILRVNVGGTVYSTKTMSIAATDTNPWIKNK